MLTQDEQELIVSALAFSSTGDVVAHWTEEQQEAMADLACTLREEYNISDLDGIELPFKSEEDIDKQAETPNIAKRFVDFIPLA
jgi:hypothetical protein